LFFIWFGLIIRQKGVLILSDDFPDLAAAPNMIGLDKEIILKSF
jgi:hypothetical protein